MTSTGRFLFEPVTTIRDECSGVGACWNAASKRKATAPAVDDIVCALWKRRDHTAENLCKTFAQALKKEFGEIPNVTDRDYLTNSH